MPDTWDYTNNRPPDSEVHPGPPILTRFAVGLCIAFTLAYHTMDAAKGTWWERLGHFGALDLEDLVRSLVFLEGYARILPEGLCGSGPVVSPEHPSWRGSRGGSIEHRFVGDEARQYSRR